MSGPESITFTVRREAGATAEQLAHAKARGAVALVCSKCKAACLGTPDGHANATKTAAALRVPLIVVCHECTIASGVVSREEVEYFRRAGGGFIAEVDPLALFPPKAKA